MCKTCPYWDESSEDENRGWCFRHAPKPLTHPDESGDNPWPFVSANAFFPQTESDDFCGEHPDFPAYIASLKTTVPSEVEALELQLAGDGGALLVLRTAINQGMTISDFTVERLMKEVRRARKIMTAIAAEKAMDTIKKSDQP
jgi:hypothetical protein